MSPKHKQLCLHTKMALCGRGLLRGLATMARLCFEYEETFMKGALWSAIMGLLSESNMLRTKLKNLEFLSQTLCIYKSQYGLALYTMSKHETQCNVNLVVPTDVTQTFFLMKDLIVYLERMHPAVCLNLKPLMTHIPDLMEPDVGRVIPRTTPSSFLVLDADHSHLLFRTHKILVIASAPPSEVKSFLARDHRPLSKMSVNDWPGCVYWTRASCGTLVAFCNPERTLEAPPSIPECLNLQEVYTLVPESLHFFVRALHPETVEDTVCAITNKHVPSYTRAMLLALSKATLGIHDSVIAVTGFAFGTKTVHAPVYFRELYAMGEVMRSASESTDWALGESLCFVLEQCEDQYHWRKWVIQSKFVEGCMEHFRPTVLRRMCERCSIFVVALTLWLYSRIGNWSGDCSGKATIVVATATHERMEEWKAVQEELARIARLADETAQCLLRDEEETSKRKEKRSECSSSSSRNVSKEDVHQDRQPSSSLTVEKMVTTTHEAVVDSLRSRWPAFEWRLIGSGIFFDDSDVDVVAIVQGDEPLAIAYERVQEATGFLPHYDRVDGTHVAILHGRLLPDHSAPIDIQVLRDTTDVTPAEEKTKRSLALTERLRKELDSKVATHVRTMHSWFAMARLKGHCFGALPGVAVTCISVLLGCKRSSESRSNFTSMLAEVCEFLRSDAPIVRFDDNEFVRGKDIASRPTIPLSVLVNEENVATRMTVGTTRHLLDVLAFGASVERPYDLTADRMEMWRNANMFVVAHVRPKTKRAVSHTLHSALAAMDGHPLIDAVHVHDHPDESLTIRCTLHSDHEWLSKYGLGPEESIRMHANEGRAILVRRSNSFLSVAVTPAGHRSHHEGCAAPSLNDHLFPEGTKEYVVPRAVYVTTDVLSLFDRHRWEVVWRV